MPGPRLFIRERHKPQIPLFSRLLHAAWQGGAPPQATAFFFRGEVSHAGRHETDALARSGFSSALRCPYWYREREPLLSSTSKISLGASFWLIDDARRADGDAQGKAGQQSAASVQRQGRNVAAGDAAASSEATCQ